MDPSVLQKLTGTRLWIVILNNLLSNSIDHSTRFHLLILKTSTRPYFIFLAYNLADGGFDVWMGNARGNRNSRFHVSLDPDSSSDKVEFFDFTFEEIAILDIPAMIDYILQYTGHEQLHYIGHSQGGTCFFILSSMMPEYNQKIKSAHLLAGVGYQGHFPNGELTALAMMTDIIWVNISL